MIFVVPRPGLKRILFNTMLCVSLLTFVWEAGQLIRSPKPSPAAITEAPPAPVVATDTSPANQPTSSPAPQIRPVADVLPVALHDANVGGSEKKMIVLASLAALLSLFALVAQRQETLTEDSPKFVTALEDWSPVIESSYATPRALKRFVNRVRYFAMQQTPDIPSSSLREKAISWIYRKICKLPLPPNRLETKPNISEDFLVGLAAIDAFGGATQRDRFGEENVSSAYELAKKKFCRPAADLTRFEDVYPKEQLLKCHGEYSILAAGAQPKN